MRKLTAEEFFDMVSVWYDETDNTLTLQYEGNMAWMVDGSMAQSSNGTIMFYSNHEHNKKIFMNTGTYDKLLSMDENVENAYHRYAQEMKKLNSRMLQCENTVINIEM